MALAAVLCRRHGLMPRQVGEPARMAELQLELLRRYQHIPGLRLADPLDMARKARITASGRFQLAELPANGPVLPLDRSRAQMLPLAKGPAPTVQFIVDVAEPTTLVLELSVSEKPASYTTEMLLGRREIKLAAGPRQTVTAAFEAAIDQRGYAFYCLLQNPHVSVHATDQRLTGILAVHHETTTGVLNPIRALGSLARQKDITFLVDAISSLGGEELRMDEWGLSAPVKRLLEQLRSGETN